MIKLYKPDETDFLHNGIGILSDAVYEATVQEDLNGVYVLSFKYPLFSPHGLDIKGQSLIQVPTPDGDQLFRVANPSASMGILSVFCYHVFYDLIDNFIEDTNIVSKTGIGALTQLKGALQYPSKFDFFSDIGKLNNARLVRMNPIEAMLDTGKENSFLNRWGGELKRDNFLVSILENRGRDRGVIIQHKKDLLGYEASVDWQSPITKIMPQGFDGLLLPEKYVTSANVGKYVNPKIQKVDFEDVKAAIGDYANDDDAIPLEDAYNILRQRARAMFEVNHVDQPLANYTVTFQELSQTEEYKDFAVLQSVYMGDTVTVQHDEDNIYIQAKVISYKYDPVKQRYIEVTLGNFKDSFTSKTNKIDQIRDEVLNITSDIDKGLGDADERIKKLKEDLNTTNGNLDTTNGKLNNTNNKVGTIENGLNETKDNLNTTTGKVNGLETGLDKTKIDLNNTKNDLSDTKTELGNTKTDLNNTKNDLKDTKTDLGNTKTDLNTTKNKVTDLEGQVKDLGPNILEQARQNATDLINSGFGSYVRVYPDRILIMDTNNEMTAKKVWQWNVNGLGYSSTGVNGPYGVAITKDGSIVADFIKTGKLNAGMVQTGFNEYGNTIKMMPEGLQSQVNNVKRMELNNLGQLMIYDADATRIGSLGYQYRVSDNSKGVTMNITPGRYLSFSVYNPTTDLHDPNFEIVDTTTTYGTRGIFAWRDMWMNARQLVLSDANLGAKKNYIQELLFTGNNTKRLGLISDTGIDFLLRENNVNTAWAGLNSTSFYTYKPLHVYSGGISFNEDGTYLKGGIRKDATNKLLISNEGKTQFMYKEGDTSYVLIELSTWDRINFWKTLDMNGYSIINADIRSTLTNVNAASLSTYSLDTSEPIEKEMFAPLNSNETYTHVGNGSTVDGYTRIDLPDFLQYETENYHVFLSKYGRGDIWVSNRTETYFTIESDRDIDFSYEIKIVKKEPEVSKFGFRAAAKRKPSIFDRHTEEKVLTESDIETVNNEGGIKL
ncbi:phage tail spike protein [Bacillus cereus]|uniref:phage tail spike protein n=1 Tax=Bacillus cereus TaxID=1396 RepID=UPI0024073938|nr:phage tail spike protein [Bacillus cereus]MCU5709218.1 phage tail protein [Bacillus cereus]MDF9630562.1 phage tail spike protein [Bacillus cereus]MDG1585414.1 phage tail spike protein [Bacillus cereus]MDG1633990.1 phage tail spike protein [Bacillus cereus]MEC2498423.1 phage tail spike protein [Bacillus cereus]